MATSSKIIATETYLYLDRTNPFVLTVLPTIYGVGRQLRQQFTVLAQVSSCMLCTYYWLQ